MRLVGDIFPDTEETYSSLLALTLKLDGKKTVLRNLLKSMQNSKGKQLFEGADFDSKNLDLEMNSVETEYCYYHKRKDIFFDLKIDLYIGEVKYIIFIENKVTAPLTEKQITKYQAAVQNMDDKDEDEDKATKYYLGILTNDKEKHDTLFNDKFDFSISWQEVYDGILEGGDGGNELILMFKNNIKERILMDFSMYHADFSGKFDSLASFPILVDGAELLVRSIANKIKKNDTELKITNANNLQYLSDPDDYTGYRYSPSWRVKGKNRRAELWLAWQYYESAELFEEDVNDDSQGFSVEWGDQKYSILGGHYDFIPDSEDGGGYYAYLWVGYTDENTDETRGVKIMKMSEFTKLLDSKEPTNKDKREKLIEDCFKGLTE